MKKILSFLIVLGALTFVNFDVFTYTFNGSYDFSNIDLNVSLTELNGASLNDLFDYDYFEHLYLAELPNGVRSKFEIINGNVVFAQHVQEYIIRDIDIDYFDPINHPTIAFVGGIELPNIENITDTIFNKAYVQNFSPRNGTSFGLLTSYLVYYVQNDGIYFTLPKNLYNNLNDVKNALDGTTVYYELENPLINTDIEQSLLFYNLENINIDLLNYYFAVWLLNTFNLPVGDLWSYAFNAGYDYGYDNGYDDGYNNGYDSGNLQGYNDGYDEGLFDYHTGNNYGSYDFTLSEPYDQATQANISLLNIFSMIIGVAMSMLGFIINIDIFGISIASILGTLAIGVSIVWLLKLIRG